MSTHKVYGDAPNSISLKEIEKRWVYVDERFANGLPETFTTINPNTPYSALPSSPPTSLSRNTDSTSRCRAAASAGAA